MNKKQLIDTVKGVLEHIKKNPEDLKKFEAPAPAPIKEKKEEPQKVLRKAEPYFLSKARVDAIKGLFKKEKTEKCGDMSYGKNEVTPGKGMKHPPNGKLTGVRKEEPKAFQPQDKNGEGEMGKDELAPAPKPAMAKDDAPHAPGSPQDSAHDVAEEHSSLRDELKALSPRDRAKALAHLRTLKNPAAMRSPANRMVGKE